MEFPPHADSWKLATFARINYRREGWSGWIGGTGRPLLPSQQRPEDRDECDDGAFVRRGKLQDLCIRHSPACVTAFPHRHDIVTQAPQLDILFRDRTAKPAQRLPRDGARPQTAAPSGSLLFRHQPSLHFKKVGQFCMGNGPNRDVGLRSETPTPGPEEHGDRVRAGVGRDEIGFPVSIDVTDGGGLRDSVPADADVLERCSNLGESSTQSLPPPRAARWKELK